jgi:hypothetical protein
MSNNGSWISSFVAARVLTALYAGPEQTDFRDFGDFKRKDPPCGGSSYPCLWVKPRGSLRRSPS